MKPEIVKCGDVRAIGYEIKDAKYACGSETNFAYWTEVDFSKLPPFPAEMNNKGDVGVWIHPDGKTPVYCYGAATDHKAAPEGFVEYTVPGAEYAVFTATDSLLTDAPAETARKIRQCAARVKAEWLGKDGYEYDPDHGMVYEFYKDSKAYIFIPVKKA